MVINVFTYGLRPRALFKKLVGKQPTSRKEMMKRVHRYMKQEEVASKTLKTYQGGGTTIQKDSRALYVRNHAT